LGGLAKGQGTSNVTVISLGLDEKRCVLPQLPFQLSGAGAALLANNTIMFCGGLINDYFSKSCYTLSNNQWVISSDMLVPRYYFLFQFT